MIYLRAFLIFLWLMMTCALGLVWCLFCWGNPNLDRWFGRIFARGALWLSGFQVTYEGLEILDSPEPRIYVANHQSALDMAIFGLIYPRRTVIVGKKELLWIPFFGLFFKAAGNIVLNRQKSVSAIAGLKTAAEDIQRRQVSIWIFPEGTRNRTEAMMASFKKGAFFMATQAGVPIVPIVCSSLKRRVDWDKKILSPGPVRVRVLPPIQTSGYGEKGVERLTQVVRDQMHEALLSLS